MHGTMSLLRRIGMCVLLALASTLGCRTSGAPANADSGPATTTIDVQNNDFNDMTVYVVVNSQRTRLGIAPGLKTTVLTIPRYLVFSGSTLRFVGDPIGGNRTPVSEEIDVSPGDQLVMVINPAG
jgi:hypothetical protein